MAFIFHNIYICMGCHPSHWRTPSFFRGVGQPATSLMMWLYIVHFAFCSTHDSWGAFGFGSSANTAVALCNVMLLMCSEVFLGPDFPTGILHRGFFPLWRMVFPWWFVELHVSLVLNDSYEFHTEFHTMLNMAPTILNHTYVFHLWILCWFFLSRQLRLKHMKRYKEALCDKVQESSQGLLGHLLVGPFVGSVVGRNDSQS